MILHLKKDSDLIDAEGGHRFSWQAGQHSVEEELAKRLLGSYPDLFEEIADRDGISLAPDPTASQPQDNQAVICDVCGKEVASQLGLISHRRTHNKGITTSDLIPHH